MKSKTLQFYGRNVVQIMEKFFERPLFWAFETPKAFMLTDTLELMKAAGLVDVQIYHTLTTNKVEHA